MTATVYIRPAVATDVARINAVIEAAVMGWPLPERVKRLSLAGYRYSVLDLDHLDVVVAESPTECIVGVAAWEAADPREVPGAARGMLLHGLYVAPCNRGAGVGTRLLDAATAAARRGSFQGVLVKANPDAQGFFESRGFIRVGDPPSETRYPYLYWRKLDQAVPTA